jgi:hypothetical protein
MSDRGQAYSLQGVIGAIIVVSALVLGLQAISIVPFTSDGPEQGVDTKAQLEDTLDIIGDDDGLRTGVLCLGGEDPTTPDPGIISTDPAFDPIGTVLASTASQTASYNIYVVHNDTSSPEFQEQAVGPVDPITDSAVTVTREIVIFDSDPVYQLNRTGGECEIDNEYDDVADAASQDEIYLDNRNENSDIFQVVQVRVVAW